ncbi:Las1p [Sugiyamaella lignohabitans]|uniref:Las1p n=1 Tax=Sugiyamaella lignohabitans TaxID=796027 RepID=A0A161HIH9_9ASCO|nr:Las1p [Sugiyamaella lignohabitans]ANB12307.1 Las1p [Sugiyamaella lignohabitans]
MSRLPKVVAWKSESDISELKDLFYGGNNNSKNNYGDASHDPRIRALAKVKAYQTRAASLPHSIESTSLITAAILNDTPDRDSDASRMAYSMAIIRFVNGLLDPSQQSQYAIPLHLLAKTLDLPSAFVELRHVATHESLPSLEALRSMASRALDWLWHHYWSRNSYDDSQKQLESSGDLDNKRENIKELLREWRRIRRSDPGKLMRVGDGSPEGVKFWKLVKKIQTSIEQDEELFVEVLLNKNVLVPSGSDGIKKLSSSIKLFGPLFDYLKTGATEGFAQRLALHSINLLNNQKTSMDWSPTGSKDELSEKPQQPEPHFFTALTEWSKYLIVPSRKKQTINSILLTDVDEVLRELLLLPRQWNVDILESYLDKTRNIKITESSLDRTKLTELVKQMAHQVEAFHNISITPHEPSTTNIAEQRKRVRDTDSQLEQYAKRLKSQKPENPDSPAISTAPPTAGWQTVDNWTPRPIGVL